MEKLIITGGTGFIGRHLVKRLLGYGKCSIALVSDTHNFDPGYFGLIRSLEKMPLRFYTADIRDSDEISKVFRDERADTCVHLAAKISVADSIRNPDETMDINVKGTENVLSACHDSQVSNFIFASSAAVYGDVRKLPIPEDSTLKPLSPYGTSKMLGEQYVSSYQEQKKIKNAVSLRIFNAYGSGQSSESDVITKFAKGLSVGKAPVIYGNGIHTRDFISVDDVADAIVLSITLMKENDNTKTVSNSVFNVGTGKPTSIKQLAQKMIEILHLDLEPLYQEEGETNGVILHSYADITNAREILRFIPRKDIDTGLRELLNKVQ